MQFGYATSITAQGITPSELARSLEARDLDSLWICEHSHIPTSRETPFPMGGDIPEGVKHMMSAMVSATAALTATEKLVVGTGVCLLLQHDLIDLALDTATLDVLSGGRFRFGIGVGWNAEELRNHRPDIPFKMRYSAMRERVEALRIMWREDIAAYEGRWDRLASSWIYPKPTDLGIPVCIGGVTPVGMSHAAEYADHWIPIASGLVDQHGKLDIEGGITKFRFLLAENERDATTVPISLFVHEIPAVAELEKYERLDVERVIFLPTSSRDETLVQLDELAERRDSFQ